MFKLLEQVADGRFLLFQRAPVPMDDYAYSLLFFDPHEANCWMYT